MFLLPSLVCADGWTPYKQWSAARPSEMSAPPFQGFSTDPDTGLHVWRLGGSAEEMGSAVAYPLGKEAISTLHAQHFYSRTSPTNSSETHALGSNGQNRPYAALWRLADKKLVAWVPGPAFEADIQQRQLLWDKRLDNVYWFTQGNALMRAQVDFATDKVRTEVWDRFPDFDFITFGFGEGNFSDDGDRLVLAGRGRLSQYLYFQPYSVNSRHKYPRRQATFPRQNEFDWVSVDPSGKWIVFDRHVPGLQTVIVPFAQAATAKPRVLYPDSKHSDFVVDKTGRAWLAYGNWRGLFAVVLENSEIHKLWPRAGTDDVLPHQTASGHIARVAGRPGYLLLSRNLDGGLYFFNLEHPGESLYAGNSRHGRAPASVRTPAQIARWGVNKDGEVGSYMRQARGAVSASGRYVFFVSDYQTYLGAGGYDPEPAESKAFLNMIDTAGLLP